MGARDRYIEVILQRTPAVMARFLRREQARNLSAPEQTDLWRLLEMQRHSQLMFTSCGWFFEEISRPETVQILSYAARAMELASELTGIDLEMEFRDTLAEAPSNLAQYGHGAAVYDALVQPTIITPAQVAGHYAIASILVPTDRTVSLYNYTVTALDCDGQPQVGDWRQRFGTTTLAVGRVEIRSIITCECHDLVYAVLHTGGRDFHCCVKPFASRRQFEHLRQRLLTLLPQVNHSEIAVILQSEFDKEYYTLRHLFARERQQLMRQLTQQTLDRLEQLYRQIYLDNYSVLMALRQENLPLPPELEAAATVTLNRRLLGSLRSLELDDVPHDTILELQRSRMRRNTSAVGWSYRKRRP
ncbi:MAG: DUF3536 domain-containing protein [Synechococcaceae cyanobacterium SM2_3_60]|nr:DUF3536 domain-containing protein [Synechococcaceae cyanobacterium SM2_3_60]